jgi:hypothetical protein
MNRIVSAALIAVALVTSILAADRFNSNRQSEGDWLPDSEAVDRVEHAVRQMPTPTTGNLVAASLDNYGRYYTGLTLNGRKVIYGAFLADLIRYPPGIHILPVKSWPLSTTGGGCGQLNVWYDVVDERVTEFHCAGLG